MFGHNICLILANSTCAVAVVGLEYTVYEVMESEEILEVCVRVYTPISDCPIPVPFTLIVTAFEGSAGTYLHLVLFVSSNFIILF